MIVAAKLNSQARSGSILTGLKIVSNNRKARFNYFFKEIYEAKRATQKDALRAFLKDPRNDKKRAAVNKAFPGPKQSKDKLRSVLKAGKTMTGEKPAEIEINPKMGDKTT